MMIFIAVTFWLTVSCLNQIEAQNSLQCPSYSLVNISSEDRDTLVFADFPPDTERPDDVYDPGALGPWYTIAAGIINVVRPGSVTEDVIVPLVNSSSFNFSDLSRLTDTNGDELEELGRDLASWWAGIIALTILGGLLSISFLVCCCCFGLCRCCGNCGGSLRQEETNKTNCLTIVFTVILILFTCGLLVGVVFAFFSNQQVFNSVNEFEETISDTFDLAENFVNDSILQIETLLCELNDTLDITVDQANELISQVNNIITTYDDDIYAIVDQTLSVSREIENTQTTLISINNSVSDLQSSTNSLNNTLQAIAENVTALRNQCIALPMGMGSVDCSALNADEISNGLNVDYNQVPDISEPLRNIQDILSGVNLTNTALEGNNTFNSAVSQIMNLTNSVDQVINDGLDELRNVTDEASDRIREFTDTVVGEEGYINDGRDLISTGFDTIHQYDTPRYAIGVVISCIASVVIIIVIFGVLCGLCGFRTDRAPYERTDISNCGGITLIGAAGFGFVIGFLVMILAALVFFTGGVTQKFCDDAAPSEYIIIARTVDDPSITGGDYLLSEALFQNGSIPLTVSGILQDCSGNSTVYQALKLDNLGFIQDIQNFTNISLLIPDVSQNISNIAEEIADVFNSSSFVPSDLQERLENFTNSGVDGINITMFREQIDQQILSFNVSEQIIELEMLRDNLTNAGAPADALADDVNNIINGLRDVELDVAAISSEVDELEDGVNQLDANAQNLTNITSQLLTNINTTFMNLIDNGITPLVNNASDVFPRAVGYAQQLVDYAFNALEFEVGNCYPLFAVYSGFYEAFCEFTLDGLNGFWLALGMCGTFLVPVIIFAIITSQYYRRMKYEEDLGIPYEDSFPLKTY